MIIPSLSLSSYYLKKWAPSELMFLACEKVLVEKPGLPKVATILLSNKDKDKNKTTLTVIQKSKVANVLSNYISLSLLLKGFNAQAPLSSMFQYFTLFSYSFNPALHHTSEPVGFGQWSG